MRDNSWRYFSLSFVSRIVLNCLCLAFFSLSVFAQKNEIDSIRNELRNEKDDTIKVKTLYTLSEALWTAGQYDTAMSYAEMSRILSEKVGYKEGIALAYTIYGIICEDKSDLDKAMQCHLKALAINNEIKNKRGIAKNLYELGIVNDERDNYSGALDYDTKALALFEELGDKRGICNTYGEIGNVYNDEGNIPKALDFLFKALTINRQIKNKHGTATNLSNMGVLYHKQGNYSKAIECDSEALSINQEIGNKHGIATGLGNLGTVYHSLGNYSKTLQYHLKSLKMFEEMGAQNGISMSLTNIGDVYAEKARQYTIRGIVADSVYKHALTYFFRSLIISKKIGDKKIMAYTYSSIGVIYMYLKDYKVSREYQDSAIVFSKGIGEKEAIQGAYVGLSKLDSATGNFKDALVNFKNYIIYRDSIVNESNTKKTVQAEMNFDFEQKQAELKAGQEKKDAVDEQEKKKQRLIRDSFIGGFVLMLALAFFVFRGYKQKQKANVIITLQKEEVEKQKVLVEHQKELVEQKNKDIMDSINYAKRLQDAILPPLSLVKQYLPEYFLLYKPKDVVAGDFYWMERVGDLILIAAADCTGHGVPGALVSVVCSNALNRTVKEFRITETGKILDKVRELVLETFEKSEGNIQDGMDISLIAIQAPPPPKEGNPEQAVFNPPLEGREAVGAIEVQWSGANNPLWHIHKNELLEVPADKQPIGMYYNSKPFTTHTMDLQKGDTIYLFTDGYADQFGGSKGKKFKYKQLQDLLIANVQITMKEQKAILENSLGLWKGDLEQVDDILIIGIRI